MSTTVEKTPVYCPHCGRKLMVPVSAMGKQGKCPACANVFLLELPLAAAVVEPDLQPPGNDPFGTGDGGEYSLQPLPGQASPTSPFAAGSYAATPYAATPYAATPYAASPYGASPSAANPPAGSPFAVNPYGTSPPTDSAVPNPYTSPAQPNADHAFGLEPRGWDAGMMGGLLMMVIAVLWFFGGLFFGIFFIYPPILFIIGLVGFVRGLFTGNVTGQ